jgi:hypothetical protein
MAHSSPATGIWRHTTMPAATGMAMYGPGHN